MFIETDFALQIFMELSGLEQSLPIAAFDGSIVLLGDLDGLFPSNIVRPWVVTPYEQEIKVLCL